jgi:hypothetical protein
LNIIVGHAQRIRAFILLLPVQPEFGRRVRERGRGCKWARSWCSIAFFRIAPMVTEYLGISLHNSAKIRGAILISLAQRSNSQGVLLS